MLKHILCPVCHFWCGCVTDFRFRIYFVISLSVYYALRCMFVVSIKCNKSLKNNLNIENRRWCERIFVRLIINQSMAMSEFLVQGNVPLL